jgi:hypothetical protein
VVEPDASENSFRELVTFEPGETSKTVLIPILQDAILSVGLFG